MAGTVGILMCQVLEEEISHLLLKDPEIKKISVVRSEFSSGVEECLQNKGKLSVLSGIDDFQPETGEGLEVLLDAQHVGLHMDKKLLQDSVLSKVRIMEKHCGVVLLGYGLCGNSLDKLDELLKDISIPVLMPTNDDGSTIDDCVCLVLGGTKYYMEEVRKMTGTWFSTPGWYKYWETLLLKELGAPDIKTVKWIFDKVGYKRVLTINTHISDEEKLQRDSNDFAQKFDFCSEQREGSLELILRALQKAKRIAAVVSNSNLSKKIVLGGNSVDENTMLKQLIEHVVEGDEDEAKDLAQNCLDNGTSAWTIIQDGLIPAMKIVSEKYDKKEYYLPQMLLSADAFYNAFSIVKPLLKSGEGTGKGTIVIGVVEGDIHDIGKNLVKTVIEASGYECIDMGRDVMIEDYIAKVKEVKPDYLMLSTLMTPTMANMRRVIEGLVEEGIRDTVKVVLGGGPVSMDFAKKIGADNYCDNEKETLKWLNSFQTA